MRSRNFLVVAVVGLVAIASAQIGAAARGSAGFHGFAPALGRGFHDGYMHTYYGRGFSHAGHHDRWGRHWAGRDFGRWDGHGSRGRGGHFEPGHWHLSSGFGDRGHRIYADGVWHR